jgi:hypothetical protein
MLTLTTILVKQLGIPPVTNKGLEDWHKNVKRHFGGEMTKVNAIVISGRGPAGVCAHTLRCCAFNIRATDIFGNVDRFSENFTTLRTLDLPMYSGGTGKGVKLL